MFICNLGGESGLDGLASDINICTYSYIPRDAKRVCLEDYPTPKRYERIEGN